MLYTLVYRYCARYEHRENYRGGGVKSKRYPFVSYIYIGCETGFPVFRWHQVLDQRTGCAPCKQCFRSLCNNIILKVMYFQHRQNWDFLTDNILKDVSDVFHLQCVNFLRLNIYCAYRLTVLLYGSTALLNVSIPTHQKTRMDPRKL